MLIILQETNPETFWLTHVYSELSKNHFGHPEPDLTWEILKFQNPDLTCWLLIYGIMLLKILTKFLNSYFKKQHKNINDYSMFIN